VIGALVLHPNRHAELVSASTVPQAAPSPLEGWTLKQVQGDGGLIERQKLLGVSFKGIVG